MTIKDVLKTEQMFFSGTPNQTTFVSSTKSRELLEIYLLSLDSMLEIIGKSTKI